MRRTAGGRKQIGQMLIEKGLINEQQLNEALETQKQTSEKVGQTLVTLGHVDRIPLYETLAEQLNVSFVDLSKEPPDPKVATLVERSLCERYQALPVARGDGCIRVAMAEPDDVIAADDLKMQLQQAVEPMLADPDSITMAITHAFETPSRWPLRMPSSAPRPRRLRPVRARARRWGPSAAST
jgi:type IV pilus assembly protein PilB